MGKNDHCCVPLCTVNRTRVANVISFHKLPSDDVRCKKWLDRIPRHWQKEGIKDPLKELNRADTKVCSRHFVGGRKSDDPTSVAYCPTLFPDCPSTSSNSTSQRTTKRSRSAGFDSLEESTLKRPAPKTPTKSDSFADVWLTTDHDYIQTRCDDKTFSSPGLNAFLKKFQDLESENQHLKKKGLSIENIMTNEKECMRKTGLPNYATFSALRDYLLTRASDGLRTWRGVETVEHQPCVGKKPGPQRKLSFDEELFLVLTRLRTGVFNHDVAQRFGISEGLASETFSTWIIFLERELKTLFELPPRSTCQENSAPCFENYDTLTMIIDCTEIFTEKPKQSGARKNLFSSYKNHETCKFLVAMSPNLAVTYVSKGWAGRTSDAYLTVHCDDLLESLHRGDTIMADRGFGTNMVVDQLKSQGVKSIIPAFKGRDRPQFTAKEAIDSESCSKPRVHIERIIQRIKTFHILNTNLKLSMQDIMESVFIVCAYLTNFQMPIIR